MKAIVRSWIRQTPFLVECLSSKPVHRIEREVDEDTLFWLPVIAGIATREEVDQLTIEELQVLCVVANKKLEILGGG